MNSIFKTDTITTYRVSSTRGTGGELVKTYTSNIDVIGSFQNVRGDWTIAENIEAFRKTKRFFCDVVDIIDTDRIIYDDKTYEIIDVGNVKGHHLEIDLRIRSTS